MMLVKGRRLAASPPRSKRYRPLVALVASMRLLVRISDSETSFGSPVGWLIWSLAP